MEGGPLNEQRTNKWNGRTQRPKRMGGNELNGTKEMDQISANVMRRRLTFT